MSSTITTMNLSKYGLKIRCIKSINTAEALVTIMTSQRTHYGLTEYLIVTNNTDAPQGDILSLMYPCCSSSSNCSFNSFNLAGAIRYSVLETSSALSTRLIVNSTSREGGSGVNSAGNTSLYSLTIVVSSNVHLVFRLIQQVSQVTLATFG
jgi:hypothetical protein